MRNSRAAGPLHPTGTDSGKTYIYSGNSGALIRVHDGQRSSDFLGYSLASIGDLDGDATSDYLIGAPDHLVGTMPLTGRIHAYSGASGSHIFSISGNAAYQRFGISLARLGDVDSDGIDDLAVGSADSASGGGSGRGRVDVFSGGVHTTIVTLIGQAPDDGSLGSSLAGGADFDGDGIPDLVVGDANHLTNGIGSGAAIIYSGASWSPLYSWLGQATTDQFGFEVACLNDVNGDGVSDVLIGSSIGANDNGRAYLYSGKTGHELYEFVSDFTADKFGQQVASAGDLTGDGLTDLIIGAENDGQSGAQNGRAYLFAGNALFLQASSSSLNAGDTLNLAWHCREPSVLTALAVVKIASVPTFVILDLGYADSIGERSLSATVPFGLSGLDLDLQAFALDSLEGVVSSSLQHLTFL